MPKRIPTTDLRVADVLGTAPAVRETVVRTVGPALVLVIEQEAPVRMIRSDWSESEFRSMLAWTRNDPDAYALVGRYFDSRATMDGDEDVLRVERERQHELRVSLGESVTRTTA